MSNERFSRELIEPPLQINPETRDAGITSTYKSGSIFKEVQVIINPDKEFRNLLDRLQEIHEKFNSSEYDKNAFSPQLKENTV